MKKGDKLFVYGTLRVGESADLSKRPGIRFIGEDFIDGILYNLGWYPGVKLEKKRDSLVNGDVFEITDASITHQLDAYESYPNLYSRSVVETVEGQSVWVYTYNHPVHDGQIIDSGNWRDRLRGNGSFDVAA